MESPEYLQAQAEWDRETRLYLYRRFGLQRYERILDAGGGNCIIAEEIADYTGSRVTVVDTNPLCTSTKVKVIKGDVMDHTRRYDAVVCRFFLMWQKDMYMAVEHLASLLRRGGLFMAIAEPDYGGMIEVPDLNVREIWINLLKASGANPFAGRYLIDALNHSGLSGIETGLSSTMLTSTVLADIHDITWKELRRMASEVGLDTTGWDKIKKGEKKAIENNRRYLFLPVFWAVGWRI